MIALRAGQRSPRNHVWQAYVAAGAALCALYVFVPPFRGSAPVMCTIGLSSTLAILLGVRLHSPSAAAAWSFLAAGQVLFFLGDVYTYGYTSLAGVPAPFPSVGDASYIAVYPVLMAGVVLLVRRRNPHRDNANLIDALILTIGVGLLSWVFLIAPYVHDTTLALPAKLVSIAYPMGDVMLLAAFARLAVDNGKRRPSFYLLASSVLVLLSTDAVYGFKLLDGTYAHQLWLDAGWIAYYLLFGAAALHPSMRTLDEVEGERSGELGRTRLALLTGSAMIAPAIELAREAEGNVDLKVIIAASAGLFLLVVARMAGLVKGQARSTARERALRGAGEALVAATGRDEIHAAALAGLRTLAGGGYEARIVIERSDGVAVVGAPIVEERGLPADPAAELEERAALGAPFALSRVLRHALALGDDAERAYALPLTLREGGRGLAVVAGADDVPLAGRAALRAVAAQISLALESALLTEDLMRRESEARFASLVAHASDLITVIGADATILYQSPSVERVLGYRPAELTGRRFDELLAPGDRGSVLALLTGGIAARGPAPELVECALRHRDGAWLQFEILHTNLLDDEHVRGIVLNGRDVSERKAFEDQLAHQAFHDSLTGLANRALFADRVEHALTRSRQEDVSVAVIFADLDDFKTINDSLGHAAGDEVLLEVADRLKRGIRPSDTAARFGGDEFALLLEDVDSAGGAAIVAERVLAAFRAPIDAAGTELFVSPSLGIVLARAADGDVRSDELLRNADVAMYMAKRDGKGAYRIFEPAMHEEAIERLELRADLQRAVETGQFELYYQPVVRLADGGVYGLEALVRWHHPRRGLLGPDYFVPLAEETGVIVPLGRWVLHEGCRQARAFQDRFPELPPLSVSLNLSARQLQHPDVVRDVAEALEAAGLAPEHLVLEITESLMMADVELGIARLFELKTLGVRLAMDDFGTGYSSLSYLSRFPVDILKMDRSFLAPGTHAESSGLAAAVVALARTMQLRLVAEGIEHPAQMAALRDLGCELGQGFLFAHAMHVDAVEAYLARFVEDDRLEAA